MMIVAKQNQKDFLLKQHLKLLCWSCCLLADSRHFIPDHPTKPACPGRRTIFNQLRPTNHFSVFRVFTFSMRISRSAIFLMMGSSSDSTNFLMATICPVSLFLHLNTTPYEPSPILLIFSYFSISVTPAENTYDTASPWCWLKCEKLQPNMLFVNHTYMAEDKNAITFYLNFILC